MPLSALWLLQADGRKGQWDSRGHWEAEQGCSGEIWQQPSLELQLRAGERQGILERMRSQHARDMWGLGKERERAWVPCLHCPPAFLGCPGEVGLRLTVPLPVCAWAWGLLVREQPAHLECLSAFSGSKIPKEALDTPKMYTPLCSQLLLSPPKHTALCSVLSSGCPFCSCHPPSSP